MFSPDQWLASTGVSFYNGVATQSLRFDNARNSFLNRTPSIAGNQKTWTWSGWVKRNNSTSPLFRSINASGFVLLRFLSDQINLIWFSSNTAQWSVTTNALYRDFSAWYHIVVAFDTTQGTASNRVKIYVNGVQETSLATASYPNQNSDHLVNQTLVHSFATTGALDAYMAEVNLIDGQALDPTSFGETKNGVWIAKEYTGSYGTNGFRLQFNQTGTGTASSSTIGADTSGNTNHFTSSGIVASDCAMPDSPENNFCTLNSINASSNVTVSNGNLSTVTSSGIEAVVATLGVSTGKWYWEVHINATSTTSFIGITTPRHNNDGASFYDSNQLLFADVNGSVYYSSLTSRSLPAFEINDIVKIKLDLDNQTMEYSINDGSYVGSITLTNFDSHVAGETWLPTTKAGASGGVGSFNHTYNFGQDSSFAGNKTSGSATAQDANGIGDFYYAPPSGFLALCTSNLPEPTISPNANTQADDYFNTVLYTGNSSTQSITGVGFQPDWLWIKSRNQTHYHGLFDSNRGSTKRLFANVTDAESTQSAGVTSFDSDGFSLGSNAGQNQTAKTYVGWNWKANGGTTSSNSDGSITSTVQANTTAGFSIVTYTGTGALATVGHSLGVKPSMMIIKNRDDSDSGSAHWLVYHEAIGATHRLKLDSTEASGATSVHFNNTEPTSSVFTVNTSNAGNGSSDDLIAYCFAEVEGYSKFGSYTGNGSTDGTFVYTGFRPAFIIYKKTSGTGNWGMLDNTRSTSNLTQAWVASNLANAETNESTRALDFLSNGFKARGTNADLNTNSATYIYMAFAENPFKYANAR